MTYPAIGIIEVNSVARGVVICDVMVKKTPVEVVTSQPICPGKFIVIIAGEVAQVTDSIEVGAHYGGHMLVDSLVIQNIHPQVIPALRGTTRVDDIGAVGIIETFSVTSCVLAADASCKAANIQLMELRLGTGLGGKAFLTLTGELHEVEAAIEGGIRAIDSGLLVHHEIIPAPHIDTSRTLA